jgi:hypothetical protein
LILRSTRQKRLWASPILKKRWRLHVVADVIQFPEPEETEERVLMLMLYKPLGKHSDRIAARMAEELVGEVMDAVADIEGIQGCYWVADKREIH